MFCALKNLFLSFFFAGIALVFISLGSFFTLLSFFLWLVCLSYGFSFLAFLMPKPYKNLCFWGKVLSIEPLSYLAIYSLFPLSFLKAQKSSFSERPILLIHGYFNFSSVWLFHRYWLKKRGFSSIYTINLGNPFACMETYIKKIEKKIAEIKEQSQCKKMILIGHSMGGIIASYYALSCSKPDFIEKVITLSAPLKGTKVAKIAWGKCARQMEENSPFLKDLKEKMEQFEGKTQFFHLACKPDHLVIPYSSSFFFKNSYVIFEDIGHVSLLYSLRVNRVIAKWLKEKTI